MPLRPPDLTMLLTAFGDWRAPGVEKGLQQAIRKIQFSDYEAKQILANKGALYTLKY